MLIDVYQSTVNADLFASVPADTSLAKLDLVTKAGSAYEGMQPFAKGVDLLTQPRAGFNGPVIEADIHDHGYSLHHVTVTVEVRGPQPRYT